MVLSKFPKLYVRPLRAFVGKVDGSLKFLLDNLTHRRCYSLLVGLQLDSQFILSYNKVAEHYNDEGYYRQSPH